MAALDLRGSSLGGIYGNPGMTRPLTLTWLDSAGDPVDLSSGVSAWVGGTLADVTDFTGATEYAATISGAGSNIATIELVIPSSQQPVRVVFAGAVVMIDQVYKSTEGTLTGSIDRTVVYDSYNVTVTSPGVVAAQYLTIDDDGYVVAIVPSLDGVLSFDGDGFVVFTYA